MSARGKMLWLAVTADKYELPLIVADSAQELAQKLGRKTSTIKSEMSRVVNGKSRVKGKTYGYLLRKVEG